MNPCCCEFCTAQAKYWCPRCQMPYCSLNCYRHPSHQHCSEEFYKDQVMEELQTMKGSSYGRRMVEEVLLKMRNENQDTVQDVPAISIRLAGVDLDDSDAVWSKLDEEEKRLFEKALRCGSSHFMTTWTPWWTVSSQRWKIEELSDVSNVNSGVVRKDGTSSKAWVPSIIKNIPKVSELLRKKSPNPNLAFSVVAVALSYVYLQRLYNGDMLDGGEEGFETFFKICKPSDSVIYANLQTCLCDFNASIQQDTELASSLDPVEVSFEDLRLLCTSDDAFIVRALSHFSTIVRKGRKLLKVSLDCDYNRRMFLLGKKLLFYAAFANENNDRFRTIGEQAGLIRRQLLEERLAHNEQTRLLEENMKKMKPNVKSLIEEII